MKKFRNVVAAVMAALMVVGMSSTALAASTETIYIYCNNELLSTATVDPNAYYLNGDIMSYCAYADAVRAIVPDGYELVTTYLTFGMGDDEEFIALVAENGYNGGYTQYLESDVEYVYGLDISITVTATSTSTESGSTTDTTTTTETTTEEVVEETVDQTSYIEDVISKIAIASVDGTGVAKTTNLTTLSIDMMKALEEYNVALEMTFIYNDTEYTLTIPAGEAIVDENIQWYGPMWLYAHYGQGTATTTTAITTTSGSTYTVVSGDTLSLIAAEHDMGLAELVAKNPQITNVNLIFPGQVINL